MLSKFSNTVDKVMYGDQSSLRIGMLTCPETGSILRWYTLSAKYKKGGVSGNFSGIINFILNTKCEYGELVDLVKMCLRVENT